MNGEFPYDDTDPLMTELIFILMKINISQTYQQSKNDDNNHFNGLKYRT